MVVFIVINGSLVHIKNVSFIIVCSYVDWLNGKSWTTVLNNAAVAICSFQTWQTRLKQALPSLSPPGEESLQTLLLQDTLK